MGRYGQAILTIGGTIIGSYFGYPALGAFLGSLVGGYLFPQQLPTVQGPRLSDLSQTSSAVGAPLPRGWGTFAVPGCVIWQSDLREVIEKEDVGGKGSSPEQTVETPTYYQDFAISLCDGEDPITDQQPIAGVRRIWANGKPIYDRRPQQDGESDSDFNQRIAASNVLENDFVLYLGTEDQEPDPTMEAALGIGNISAFRGMAYIVFINWKNKAEDGNRMPMQWKFEVYTVGALNEVTAFEYSNEYLPPWNAGADIPLYDVYNGMDVPYRFKGDATGWNYASGRSVLSGTWSSLSAAQSAAERVALRTADYYMGYSITPNSGSPAARGVTHFMDTRRTVSNYDATTIKLHFNAINCTKHLRSGTSFAKLAAGGLAPGAPVHSNGYFLNNDVHNRATAGVYQWWPGDYWSAARYRSQSPLIDHAITTGRSANPGAVLITGDCIIQCTRLTRSPGDQCAVDLPRMPGYCISVRGNLVRKQDWDLIEYSFVHNSHVLARLRTAWKQIPGESINHQARVVTQYPLNPALPDSHPDYNNAAFWTPYYEQAVALGVMPAGLTFGVDYPVEDDFIYRRQLEQSSIDTEPVSMGDIVHDIMRDCGYGVNDFDRSALDPVDIIGYVRTRPMAGRAALEPLRTVGFWDSADLAGVYTFVRRGGAIAKTFSNDELGARFESENPSANVSTRKVHEMELPRTIRLHYISQARDYEPGEQPSPTRIETEAQNDTDVEVAVVMTDDHAAQVAEIIHADAWYSRWIHEAQVGTEHLDLWPTNVVGLPVDDQVQRSRILAINDAIPSVRKLELSRDDDGNYVSTAVADPVDYINPPPLTIVGPTELILLDLPALREEDNNAGIYAAIRPYLTGSTAGATVMRSIDGGTSYQSLGPIGTPVPIGTLLQALPSADHQVPDVGNTIHVQMNYGDLESRPAEEVFEGANAAAIGAHGRWEIVQFYDKTDLGNGVYQLTTLLRGRRGTEHNIGGSLAGDRFVMLSMGGLIRLTMSNAEIGSQHYYKAVTTGTSLADAVAQAFTPAGEALVPFSPVHIKVKRLNNDDVRISWTRRERMAILNMWGTQTELSETVEAYEIDLLAGDTLLRTLEAGAPFVEYTAADQAADFDTSGAVLTIRIHQMSAVVGRGHVGELEIVLGEIEEEGTDVEADPTLAEPDADAIILPLVYDETNQAVAPLTWTRLGDGPRITPRGLIGDGYQSRLIATAGLPAYATSSSGPLYLRATISPYDGARNATRDLVVGLVVNDATANPRLAFSIVDDPTASNVPMVACRAFTGSTQSQRLYRPDWRFGYTYTQKTSGAFEARPRGVLVMDGAVVTTAHYEGTASRCHRADPTNGEQRGVFAFAPGHTHVASIALRPSDSSVWFADFTTDAVFSVDLEASFAAQSVSATATVDFSAIGDVKGIEWAEVYETEYFLLAQYLTAGTPYLYVFESADIVNGAAPVAGDRFRRLTLPSHVQGIAYNNGVLYIARSTSGGLIHAIDLESFLAIGADGDAYTTYELSQTWRTPTLLVGDLAFDGAGSCWATTEGESAAGDDDAFLAVWASPLTPITGDPVGNVCSAYYNTGSVEIRLNDKLFTTHAWTPTPTPGAIAVGGPPQASAGQTNGFFVGSVRDVIIQGSNYNPGDYEDSIVYESDGSVQELPLVVQNPGCEDGVHGWLTELGALTARTGGTAPLPHSGAVYFFGGATAHTTASQRLDLNTQLAAEAIARIDDGDCWILAEWWGAVFTGQGDQQAVGFRFLNASLVELDEKLAASFGMSPTETWIRRSYGVTIPAGTRYVEILMDMVRVDGSNNDGYIDDISVKIYIQDPNE